MLGEGTRQFRVGRMINSRDRTENIATSIDLYMQLEQQQMKGYAEIARLS